MRNPSPPSRPRSQTTTVVAWVIAALAIVGVGIALEGRPARRPGGQTSAPQAAGSDSRPLFPVGVEQGYRLEYKTRVATTSNQPITNLALAGALRLVCLAASPSMIVRGEFAGTLVVDSAGAPNSGGKGGGTGAGTGAGEAALAEAARLPFLLEFGVDGSFRRVRGAAGTPALVGRLWGALGEYLQLMRPGSTRAWETNENDASGRYVARYEEPRAGRVSKAKLRYETLTAKTLASYDVVSSSMDFGLDARGWLESFLAAETTKANLGSGVGAFAGFEAATAIELRRTDARSGVARLAAWLADSARTVPLLQSPREENQRMRDRSLIGGLTLAEALSGLEPFEGPHAKRDDRARASRAFVALAALVRQDPGALVAVRARLEKKGPLTEALLAALRDAGTPEAQELLAEMSGAGSALDAEQRLEATRSLSRVARPTPETVAALKALRSDPDVGGQATFGLGSALHRLDQQDPALAGEVRSALTEQLAAARSPGEQAAVLTALGNAGDDATLDVIRTYVTSDEATVRGAAAQALRRIGGAEPDGILTTLSTDPSADVRFSAVDAMAERPFSAPLASALSSMVVKESAYPVRAKALNLLAQWSPSGPTVAEALNVVASRDPNADLRDVARRALAK